MIAKRELVNHSDLLKSLEHAIKDPSSILTKGVKNNLTNTLMRESLGTLLIAEVMNYLYKGNVNWSVCKNLDADSLDGYILMEDKINKVLAYIEFEQVMLTVDDRSIQPSSDIKQVLLNKVKDKHSKTYANPKEVVLNIFLDIAQNIITPEVIKELIRDEGVFGFYILTMLDAEKSTKDKYVYTVIDLNPDKSIHARIHIEIHPDFNKLHVYED